MRKGFTLLELLIVVIIVGILASLAIPRYQKATESAKAAEAYNNLNAIRMAEWAYYSKTSPQQFIAGTNFSKLAIEDPNIASTKFDYTVTEFSGIFDIEAKRQGGPYDQDRIWMHANGMIDDTSDWLTGPSSGGLPPWRSGLPPEGET